MLNNDILRSISYTLNLTNPKVLEIIALSGHKVDLNDIHAFMKNEEDPQFKICSDLVMSHFLDGLIFFKRGKDDSRPRMAFELPVTNNIVLKKLKVAFQLKEEDMHAVLEKGGHPIGRAELSAFLRKSDHGNYRECGDQVMRYFLKGLAAKINQFKSHDSK